MSAKDLTQQATDATILLGGDGAQSTRGNAELPLGELFAGRYFIERLLGRGGMGVVYRARDELVEDWVAVKLLDLGGALGAGAVDLFRREVRVARRITHSNVVRIYDLDDHFGKLFISMEYVDGADLRRYMIEAGGSFTPERATFVALKIAEALSAAHRVEVVHRDLKPENVLVAKDGRLVLSDFGIASVFDRSAADSQVVGTPTYMAPEQVAGTSSGPSVDIYALGTLLFEMLAGRPPFPGDNGMAVALARLTDAPPELRTLCNCPDELAALAMECLRQRPEDRPASTDEIAARLQEILEQVQPSAATAVPLLRTPSRTAVPKVSTVVRAASRLGLACLPFSYRGPADHDYLGEALSSELIDVLSRTKGLRVLGSSAVGRAGDERDPRVLSSSLGVDYIVDGGVHVIGEKLRVSVRVLDASGTQLTSQRFDLGIADVFELQDRAGHLIAETLRLEITTRTLSEAVPEAAVEAYLRARKILRAQGFDQVAEAVELLEKAVATSPNFEPAVAALAIATVQTWFFPTGAPQRDWGAAAEAAVNEALRLAPEQPETHVAAARFNSQKGSLREAIVSARRALELAPTSPDANHILGQLQCETGKVEEGLARLAMAYQLEPTSPAYHYETARYAAFIHDVATFERAVAEVAKVSSPFLPLHLRLRAGAFWKDRARLEAVRAEASVLGAPMADLFHAVAEAYLGNTDPLAAVAAMVPILRFVNMRFGTILRQVSVELHAVAGDIEGALEWLIEAHSTLLYDIVWLDRCPLLEPLRGNPQFERIAADVRANANSVWR